MKSGRKPVQSVRRPNEMFAGADLQIKQWRQNLGLSQRQLAKLAGIPVSTLSEIENGYRSGSSVREHLMGALRKVAGRVAPIAVEILKSEKSA